MHFYLPSFTYSSKSSSNVETNLIDDELNSLTNPFQYIKQGFNITSLNDKIENFVQSSFDLVCIIQGKSNIGKTRFINEFMKNHKDDYELFYGDFDEFQEGVVQLYEPFYQAFCFHENPNYRLEKGFFSDRSVTFNSLKKVANIASAAAPIDLGEIISIDDNEGLSVNEISGELVEFLIDKLSNEDINRKIVLILDDYQWVDSATNELLLSFIEKIKNRGKNASNFKIILSVSDLDQNLNDSDGIFKNSFEGLNKKIKDLPLFELKSENSENFLDVLFDDEGYEYFMFDHHEDVSNKKIIFSPNLKAHIRDIVADQKNNFKPGDLFNYIQALKNFDLLGIDGNLFRLISLPNEDFTFDDSEKILMESKFNTLSEDHKKIIESASHIGFKFTHQFCLIFGGEI